MLLLRQAIEVLRKDLLLEWRRRARLVAVLVFAVNVLLLFSFALGADAAALSRSAGGLLMLTLLFSSTLALGESFRAEHEQGAIEGLLLLPTHPVAIFYGKAVANTLFLIALAPLLVPAALVLFGGQADAPSQLLLLGLWTAIAAGLAGPGTLYAAMTGRLRSQDVLLPLLLFPLEVPVLVAGVRSVSLVLGGDPMSQLGGWVGLLVAFDVIYWSLCGVLFPYVVEEP
jgi:heme exporter protein B